MDTVSFNNQFIENKSFMPGHISNEQYDALSCLLSCGKFVCSKYYRTERSDYGSFLAYYVLSGKSYLHYDDKSYTLKAGEAFIIDCDPYQIYGSDKDDPCTICFAHFNGGCSRYLYDKIVEEKGYVLSVFDSSIVKKSIYDLFEVVNVPSKYKVEKTSKIVHNMLQDILSKNTKEDSPYDKAVEFARQNVENNVAIGVEDMAKKVGYSKYYFTKKFIEHFGISPYEFIIKEKIEKCKSKLINSRATISSIAYECGFVDASHMTNCFKKREGMTPSQFRKKWEH